MLVASLLITKSNVVIVAKQNITIAKNNAKLMANNARNATRRIIFNLSTSAIRHPMLGTRPIEWVVSTWSAKELESKMTLSQCR